MFFVSANKSTRQTRKVEVFIDFPRNSHLFSFILVSFGQRNNRENSCDILQICNNETHQTATSRHLRSPCHRSAAIKICNIFKEAAINRTNEMSISRWSIKFHINNNSRKNILFTTKLWFILICFRSDVPYPQQQQLTKSFSFFPKWHSNLISRVCEERVAILTFYDAPSNSIFSAETLTFLCFQQSWAPSSLSLSSGIEFHARY